MNTNVYWETRYREGGGSGKGSRGRQANRKAAYVNRLIRQRNVRSLVDWGCGDGRVARNLHVASYTGIEVSQSALDLCRSVADAPGRSWVLYDGKTPPAVGRADLALSLDVIFHLTDDEMYHRYLDLLFGSAPLVCIHSSNRDEAGREHVLHRKFSLDVPSNWRVLRKPANEEEIGFWLLRRRRKRK